MAHLITGEAGDEFGEAVGDLVADAAEIVEAVGVFEAPVNAAGSARERRDNFRWRGRTP